MKSQKNLAVFVSMALILVTIGLVEAYRGKKPTPVALDYNEETHLVFMREEEKLARDVYITLGDLYPAYAVFNNIVTAEQKHTDTMKDKLEQFNITDPSIDDTVGVFTGAKFGAYFTGKFTDLTTWAKISPLDALYVGAFIEELDMYDIVHCPEVIVQTEISIEEDECGMVYTDSKTLLNSYESLLEGSKNHLRAYVKNIETLIGAGNYQAQYLSQEEVDEILGR